MSSIYDFSVLDIDHKEVALSDYKGKVLLVVNVASRCGFTPQYAQLEAMYQEFKDQGFEILAFPCNQFNSQEPGSNEEIKIFCQENYNVTFRLFDKVDVNGANSAPLYSFLKSAAPGTLGSESIKWNFTKFLVGRDGKVLKRFGPRQTPESFRDDVLAALEARES